MGRHDPWTPDLDLGMGHSLIWTDWEPDIELNPWAVDLPPLAPGEHFGAILRHPAGPNQKPWSFHLGTGICEGGIDFETERKRWAIEHGHFRVGKAMWQVQSWDPLSISPSILCDCGDHGFIKGGRWSLTP